MVDSQGHENVSDRVVKATYKQNHATNYFDSFPDIICRRILLIHTAVCAKRFDAVHWKKNGAICLVQQLGATWIGIILIEWDTFMHGNLDMPSMIMQKNSRGDA